MTRRTVALLGDSMTDCWGDAKELRDELVRLRPQVEWDIENHGLGGTRLGYGLWRLSNDYDKNGARRACLSFGGPDLVLVESFAYNNRADGQGWVDEYLGVMREVVGMLRRTTRAKVLLWNTIAPDREHFIEPVLAFHATSFERRREMADEVTLYQNALRELARAQGWAFADVAGETSRRSEPLALWINQSDGIHPSRAGYKLCAQVLGEALERENLLD